MWAFLAGLFLGFIVGFSLAVWGIAEIEKQKREENMDNIRPL